MHHSKTHSKNWLSVWSGRYLYATGLFAACLFATCLYLTCFCSAGFGEEAFKPDQATIPVKPPQDAIMLLGPDGHQFSSMSGKTVNWELSDGVFVSKRGNGRANHIVSNWHFRDADIHVEFKLPEKGSGNSGIYIHGNYELQIIHSFGKAKATADDMGALYGFASPLVNAARDRNVWQVYDIRFHAPRRDADEKITKKGRITAWLNGQLVHHETEFGEPRSNYHPYRYGTTPYLQEIWKQQKSTMVGPVFLQDHDNAVQFRNVWITPLDKLAVEYQAAKPRQSDQSPK